MIEQVGSCARLMLMALSIILLGCAPRDAALFPTQLHRDFFRLPSADQIIAFQEYDVATQYELLIVGNQVVHPPAIYLARELARRGKAIVPFLSVKLKNTQNELTIRDIVATLTEMHRLGLYDIRQDARLESLVKERIASMQSVWKPVVQRMAEEMGVAAQ